MKDIPKYFLLLLLFVFLCAPMFQQRFPFFRETKLFGAFNNVQDTFISSEAWFDRSYQEQKETYLNENFGFRNWYVKLKNQINFSLFKEVNVYDVFLGKSNYLFSNLFYRGFSGNLFKGDRYTDSVVTQLRLLNNELLLKNKKLLICITPCKESFYTEYLPDSCLSKIYTKSYYTEYVKKFRTANIPVLDLNSHFLNMKNSSPYPLFTQGAVHWTTYGAYLALDTLLQKTSFELGRKTNQIEITSVELSDSARYDDDDISRAMNLLQSVNSEKLAYPAIKYKFNQDSCYKPKVFLIGDSFYYALNNTWIPPKIFSKESYFLYYYKRAISYSDKPDVPVSELQLKEELKDTDLIILFFSIGTLDGFPYGSETLINFL